MFIRTAIISLSLLSATLAFAGSPFDITLSKTFTSGDAQSATYVSVQCNIHLGSAFFGLEHRRIFGTIETSTSSPLRVKNALDVDKWIMQAKQGQISTQPGEAGASSMTYVAIQRTQGITQYIDLKANGQVITTNSSPEAALLIQLLDLHCPELSNSF